MSLVEEFLECGPEDLLLPDADCILFMNVPGRDRTQQWHRDMRWAGEGGDYSEEGQRVRWQEIQEAKAGTTATTPDAKDDQSARDSKSELPIKEGVAGAPGPSSAPSVAGAPGPSSAPSAAGAPGPSSAPSAAGKAPAAVEKI